MSGLNFPKPPAWTESASCASIGGDIFFPIVGESSRIAIKVCQSCPVMRVCGEWADENGETTGVWGGKSLSRLGRERRAA